MTQLEGMVRVPETGNGLTVMGVQFHVPETLPEVTVTEPVLVPVVLYVLVTVDVVPERPSVPLHT